MPENNKIIRLSRDFMFTEIFNKEENVPKLERFVAVYYGYPYEKVHGNLKLVKRDLSKEFTNEARKQVDLLLILGNEKININIELNSDIRQEIIDRNVTFICKIAGEYNYKSGDSDYSNIYTSSQISFNINHKGESLIDEYRLTNIKNGDILSEKLQIDEVNMKYIKELDYNLLEEKEKIVYTFIKMLEAEEIEEFEKESEKLMEKEESKDLTKQVSGLSKKYKYVTLESEYTDQELITNTLVNGARKDAIKETQIETAKKMLEKNLDINLISECTNLSIEEIMKYTNLTKEEIEALK